MWIILTGVGHKGYDKNHQYCSLPLLTLQQVY